MPTYDYKCGACGTLFEKHLGIKHNSTVLCPECQSPSARLISKGAVVIVKGKTGTGKNLECGNDIPCCGRETRCDRPRCDE